MAEFDFWEEKSGRKFSAVIPRKQIRRYIVRNVFFLQNMGRTFRLPMGKFMYCVELVSIIILFGIAK